MAPAGAKRQVRMAGRGRAMAAEGFGVAARRQRPLVDFHGDNKP